MDFGGDRFMAGGALRVTEPVDGDLFAAGGSVDVEAPVAGDLAVLGGKLRVSAPVGGSLFALAGQLTIDAPLGRNLRVAGGQVELLKNAEVKGNVSVASGQLELRAPVLGGLLVSGGRVRLDGPIAGDVELQAGQVELGALARVAGKLRYRSTAELTRDPAAQVAGGVERLAMPAAASGAGLDGERSRHEGRMRQVSWTWTLGLMLLAALLVMAAPEATLRVAGLWRERWAASLLLGFVLLVCGPAAVLLLLVSIIGIPIALLVLLAYLALLLVAYVNSGVALGHWALQRLRPEAMAALPWRVAAAMLAVLALALLAGLPLLGALISVLALLAGLGSLVLRWVPAKV